MPRPNQEPKTLEQIQGTIRAARDSVWVVNNEIEKMQAAGSLSEQGRNNIQRNVDHLKLVVADSEITDSGEDISDLHTTITTGETTLADNPA